MLGSDPLLEAVTHVVCDEVHERSVDSDLLLALLRECAGRRPQLRVVLMSATAQSDVFAAYFGGRAPAPALSIPGRTFPVDDVFVEDFARESALADVFGAAHLGKARARLAAVRVRAAAADADAAAVADAAEWLRRVGALQQAAGLGDVHAACVALWDDRHGLLQGAAAGNEHSIDFALVAAIVRHIHATAPVDQSVLVFVPGAAEIRQCIGALPAGLHVLALHAGLSAAEQRRVFDRPPKGSRKVVVATNVAETSITIEDIGFVVDSGRVREACRDAHSGIARLATRFCSQAAATQRRGRAGRMQRGTCYRVYTRQTLAAMREHAEPEILRTPLEQVSLQAKALGHSDSL
ncbi:helicase, partial [Kickxella alabastrina]